MCLFVPFPSLSVHQSLCLHSSFSLSTFLLLSIYIPLFLYPWFFRVHLPFVYNLVLSLSTIVLHLPFEHILILSLSLHLKSNIYFSHLLSFSFSSSNEALTTKSNNVSVSLSLVCHLVWLLEMQKCTDLTTLEFGQRKNKEREEVYMCKREKERERVRDLDGQNVPPPDHHHVRLMPKRPHL